MKLIKSTILILFVLVSTQMYSQYTDVINSNRPGVSRSAFSVGTKVAQFEVGPYFIKEKRTPALQTETSGYGIDFAARYGLLLEQLELNIEGTYQNDKKTYFSTVPFDENRSNFKNLTIGAKYLIFDPYKNSENEKPNLYSWKANHQFKWSSLIPAVSAYIGVNYDTKNNPYTAPGVEGISPKVMIISQNNFNSGWVFVINLIKDRIGTDQSDFSYILTLTHSFSPKWVVFGETQGIKSDFYADNLFRFGGAYLWGKDFQLDTAITLNTKDTPSVFSVNFGASYRLDFHKDKIQKNENIDNGASAKEEGKRRSRKNKKTTDVIEDYNKKHKRKVQKFN
ncbi:transporter [Yeosuana marina]|uniref:transporter n=1 Tax=Yeosuana marina TaxID=1565536 RepID=UPI0030EE3ED6|tara:strand:- start:7 stop:1020 length:1014 start_codon:yes stop_codon:yes gene_type:complete